MEINNNNLFGVEPPKDASGKIIPLDTETIYDLAGEAINVDSFRYLAADEKKWIVTGYRESTADYKAGYTDAFTLFKPDSWDKLIDNLKNAAEKNNPACAYLNPEGKTCSLCYQVLPTENCYGRAFADILSRIETLRKKE